MAIKLYEIAEQYRQALAKLDDGDYDTEAIRETLESIAATVEDKVAAVAAYVLEIEAEAEAIAKAEARLKARRQPLERRAQWLREYLRHHMMMCDMHDITASDKSVRVRLRNNPMSVIIDDDRLLPDEFCRIHREPDKAAIKNAIMAGKDVPGAHLERTVRVDIQ